ncbi:Site-specific recombinase XerD [Rosenbergiella nectarea]|uniref:Site-specific recombinase XerD n=2 Tax=Rosenbergiella nectarea TaxID=988801 RepID=A0A1H9DGZ0_9GAMM|nr:Site-specific recombinase XerD [Rosenbergiella nectarea]
MGIMIQPTKNRFGVYHVRKAVPKHLIGILDKREIKFTLDTKDVNEARTRAPAKIIQIDMILRLAEKQLEAEQSLTDADIELIAGVWASKTMQRDELIRERYVVEEQYDGKTGLTHSPENGLIHDWLEDRQRKPGYKSQTWQEERNVSIGKLMAVELEEALEYTPTVLTPLWRDRLAWRLAERRCDLTNAYLLSFRPRLYAKSKGLDSLPDEKPQSLTFADLFSRYKDHVQRHEPLRAERRIIAYTTSANRFIEFIGQRAVKDITVTDLADFRSLIEKLPSRPSKAIRQMPLHRQVNAEGRKISPTRVENILKELSSIFRVAVEDGKLAENPLTNLKKRKVVAGPAVVRSFSQNEIHRIFSLPVFNGEATPHGAMAYWIPIILYYSGARVEEIAQLRRGDIVEEDGIPCFRLAMGEGQSIKMGNLRQFPIHSHLIEMGFLDFVQSQTYQLFVDKSEVNGKYSYNYARWWGNYIREHALTREGIKPTHSFRHSLVTLFRDLNIREEIQDSILGHNENSPDRAKASHGYGEKSVEAQRNAIEQIPRLNLERLEKRFPAV